MDAQYFNLKILYLAHKFYVMKRIKLLSVFMVLFTAIGFISCETEPIDPVLLDYEPIPEQPTDTTTVPPPPATESALFKVDFDGATYTATTYVATVGNGLTTVNGFRGTNGEVISIIIDGTTSGTYTDALMAYTLDSESDASYTNLFLENSSSVTIEIDAVNNTVSGTFNFTGQGEGGNKEFTNGVFENIPYESGPVVGGDTMTATVDGEALDYVNDLAITYTGIIGINAYGGDHYIYLSIADSVTPGPYTFSTEPFADTRARYTDDAGNEYDINGGTLNITSNEGGWIAGTFSFNVVNLEGVTIHTVTSGTFNVEYDW